MLKLKEVSNCFYPKTIEEAVNLIKESGEDTRIVGGGLHITTFPNPLIKTLIFLDNLGLDYVMEKNGKIAIGAMTTISEALRSDLLKEYLGGRVNNVFKMITTELLRNQISFGGSVAQREPYSDITSILLALDAEIVLRDGNTENTIPISQFYNSDFRAMLKKTLIKEILLNKYDKNYKFGMERFIRNATDIPLLNIAILAKVEEKVIEKANIVAGARPGPAERCTRAENFLNEKILSQELAEEFGEFVETNINSEEDIRIGKEYRKYIAGVFAKRILLGFMEE